MHDESTPAPSVGFAEVLAAETLALEERRKARSSPLPSSLNAAPATGLAFSGGGIRSAAVCMGAIQALFSRGRLGSFDYLSTVSGGGYTGACLSAAMSQYGGAAYPFGSDEKGSPDNFRDSAVVGHIRNYSNYLLPRSRSAIRNWTEAAAIILRGLLANAVCVLAFVLIAVLVTAAAFPARALFAPNFLPAIVGWRPEWRFLVPTVLAGTLVLVLIVWAMARSRSAWDRLTDDTTSAFLKLSHGLLALVLLAFAIDFQPLALSWAAALSETGLGRINVTLTGLGAFMGSVAALASTLGKFLHTSRHSQSFVTIGLRIATRAALLAAALILPLLVWAGYIALSLWLIPGRAPLPGLHWSAVAQSPLPTGWLPQTRFGLLVGVTLVCWAIMLCLRANGYSLHRLYRDRLSKAFLVSPVPGLPVAEDGTRSKMERRRLEARRDKAAEKGDLPPLDAVRLSALQASQGPYPLINAALNVQGSLKANKRGRNADFFVFTPHHVGSHLTGYAATADMERLDSRLDLATAMAISGAAASANMGGQTVRVLSPTLSLLNIRLGYYLANPRYIGVRQTLAAWLQKKAERAYLFIEMFNGLTEKLHNVYLTDGGHVENLGIYSLLERRCGLILAIDAEADPEVGCGSLLQLERYARIDLGIRIVLPWEQIARQSRKVSDTLGSGDPACDRGPHCAIGKVLYADGAEALLVYVKSSLSGDEKDYILDYAKRNPSFPHETTGDQFFSEEQFEMYRALGFHMMDGVFGGDRLAFLTGSHGFASEAEARAALEARLPGALSSGQRTR